MSETAVRVLRPVRPEVHEPASGGAEDGARNGAEAPTEVATDEEAAQVELPGGPEDAARAAEEAPVARPLRDPGAPTAAERAAHEATHLPFRSWCAECMAGRRDNLPHRRIDHENNAVPEVLMDYCFVRREGETNVVTILIIKGPSITSYPGLGGGAEGRRDRRWRSREERRERDPQFRTSRPTTD